MTRFAPLWQQAGSYPSVLDRGLLSTLWPSGGAMGVAPSAVANTMTVSLPPGSVAVPLQSGQGVALCRWDAAEVVTCTAAPPSGQSRFDLIVCQVRDGAIDSGANNDFVFSVIAGTPAASNPTVPAVPANAYAMTRVPVAGGAANLNAATLVDVRGALPGPYCSVYQAALQVMPSGALAVLHFDTIEEGAAFWDMATWSFVAPVPGRYQVSALATFDRAMTNAFLQVGRNGTGVKQGISFSATGLNNPEPGIVATVRAAAGDRLTVSGQTVGTAANTFPGALWTWAQFTYQGP